MHIVHCTLHIVKKGVCFMYKFNGFTEKANNAINLAIESAQDMGHTYIGSEHILLGLLKNNDGAAYTVLEKCGASADTLENLIKQEC